MKRWREGAGDAPEQRIGALFRRVAEPPPLAEGHLDRIAARLRDSVTAVPRRRRPLLCWVVAAVVLGSGGAVFARHELARLWDVVKGAPEPGPVATAPRPVAVARAPGPITPAPEPTPLAEAQAPTPSPAPPAAWGRSGGGRRSSGVAAPASPVADLPVAAAPSQPPPREARARSVSETPADDLLAAVPVPVSAPPASAAAPPPPTRNLGEEARLLRRAVEQLRQERDPLEALAALDDHRARFPGGLLRADADVLRVEVLLALDRDGEALALLERLELSGTPRAGELRVTRGELRAAHDCQRALADFDEVIRGTPAPAVRERALRGRAVCAETLRRLQAPR